MWLPAEHSDEENLRWAWLRAVEWINWPLFISQPIVPVLLYFFDWSPIVVSAVLISYLWRLVVPQRFVSVGLANLAPSFVLLKFLSCPIMAFLIWQQNDRWGAALALLWPVAIHVIEFPITIIEAVLAGIFPVFKKAQSTMHIGPVQQRFMAALGYTRRTPSPDEVLKEEREKAKEYPLGKESPNLPQWQLD